MTYKDLLEKLQGLSESQLNCNITVELGPEDEFYPAEFRISGDENDVLDPDHPVIFVP